MKQLSTPGKINPAPQVLLVALSVALTLCPQANAAPPDTSTGKLYAKAGGGAFFLDLPTQTSTPFIETDLNEEATGFVSHYESSSQAGPLLDLAVGAEYEAFGKPVFLEASGFFTFHDTEDVSEHDRKSAGWETFFRQEGIEDANSVTQERLINDIVPSLLNSPQYEALRPTLRMVGWIGAIDGSPVDPTPNFFWGDPIHITTNREIDFGAGDFVAGILSGEGKRDNSSLFIGPSFKRLSQEFDIFAYESNREPSVNNMTLQEELKATYYGGVVGGRLVIPLQQDWKLLVDGKLGLYYLDAGYKGRQVSSLASGALGHTTDWKVDDNKVTPSANLKLSLSYTASENITFQGGAGLEYLSDTPVMRYGESGEVFKGADTLGPALPHSPARIGYSDAFGFFSVLSVVIAL